MDNTILKSNCHTHTVYCDGKNTAEEMIEAAIEKRFTSIGFSGHSPMNFESDWAMSDESLNKYYNEIISLKEKYKDKIDVLVGIELDKDYLFKSSYSFDYVISSVHQIHKNGKIYSIDYSAQELSECVNREFEGNWNKMADDYYKSLADFVITEKTDVVGHYDLITKFNKNNFLFNEESCEYQKTALAYIEKILNKKPDMMFEVNTGAMFRCGKDNPYPAEFILRRINELGGRVTISSDSHQTDSLDYGFDAATEYCRKCGINEIWHITKNGFVPVKI